MVASLDSFLLELRNTGRISEIEYLRAYADNLPLSEGSVAASNAITRHQLQVVHQVFNITELLELVLSYLPSLHNCLLEASAAAFKRSSRSHRPWR